MEDSAAGVEAISTFQNWITRLTKRKRSVYIVVNLSDRVALKMPAAVVGGLHIIFEDLRTATGAFHRKYGQIMLAAI